LTDEHVPPEKLGGRPLVLTCKSCNNRAGHKLEAEMEKLDARIAFNKGRFRRPLRMKVRAWGSTLRVAGSGDHTGLNLHLQTKRNNPADVEIHLARLEEINRDPLRRLEFGLAFDERVNLTAAHKGWFRAGYLVAFAALGYRYAFHPQVKRLVASLESDDASLDGYVFMDASQSLPPEQLLGIREPASLIDHLAISFGRCAVILPGRRDEDPALAENLKELREIGGGVDLNGRLFQWPREPQLRLDFIESGLSGD